LVYALGYAVRANIGLSLYSAVFDQIYLARLDPLCKLIAPLDVAEIELIGNRLTLNNHY
jgi:hypothetical protein